MKKIFLNCMLAILVATPFLSDARSIHRPQDPQMPSIVTHWKGDNTKCYSLRSPFLEGYPFFEVFDKKHFDEHIIPAGPIPFRYDSTKSVDRTELTSLIETLVQEIRERKSVYTHFTILRDSNFNRRRQSGLLIVKCKEYPFVIKLFMETPDMFVKPYKKGFYPMFFYFMGGGVNRHLSGFTRIKNAEKFRTIVDNNPYWKSRVDIPRKWYWLPKDAQWITISGSNIGHYKQVSIDIPGTYCIIADAIDLERSMTLVNAEDRIESMALCNTARFIIDPHIDNFAIERTSKKIVLVDTEHFPTMVGFKKDVGEFSNQASWYINLVSEAADDIFLRDKSRWHTS